MTTKDAVTRTLPWYLSTFETHAGGMQRVVMGADGFGIAWLMGRSEAEHDAIAELIINAVGSLTPVADVEARARELPELPRPAVMFADHSYPAYSAKQMRDYALASRAALRTADAPSDEGRGLTELGAAADWQAKIDELYQWTGSAWLAGDPDNAPDAERKTELYVWLCGLGGYLQTAHDAIEAMGASPVDDGEAGADREAIARVIEPTAFSRPDIEDAIIERKWTFARARRKALAKADTILALLAGGSER